MAGIMSGYGDKKIRSSRSSCCYVERWRTIWIIWEPITAQLTNPQRSKWQINQFSVIESLEAGHGISLILSHVLYHWGTVFSFNCLFKDRCLLYGPGWPRMLYVDHLALNSERPSCLCLPCLFWSVKLGRIANAALKMDELNKHNSLRSRSAV